MAAAMVARRAVRAAVARRPLIANRLLVRLEGRRAELAHRRQVSGVMGENVAALTTEIVIIDDLITLVKQA